MKPELRSESIIAPFTCEFEGKRYRTFDKFNTGADGCSKCICIDGRVNCDDSGCHPILVDPPETATVIVPVHTTTTTTTTQAPIVRSDTQGSEKGPSQPDMAYYASRLTDVNMNSEKGPGPEAYPMEQYPFLQAQMGTPGSRGPPGPPGAMVSYISYQKRKKKKTTTI